MKNWSPLTVALTLAISVFTFPLQSIASTLDKVAVVVNNGVILESEIQSLTRTVKNNSKQARQKLPDDAALKKQVVEQLINESILLQLAQQQGMQVSEQQLDMAIGDVARQNGISMNELRKYIESEGTSFPQYRSQFRKDMLISEVKNNHIRRLINIQPREIDNLANKLQQQVKDKTEYNLSHILVAVAEKASQWEVQQALEFSNMLISDIRNGQDFGEMAVSYSADPQALNGGRMGWGELQELPEPFAKVISGATRGKIVGPARSPVGFHIFKINEVRKTKPQKIMATEIHARHILIKTTVLLTDDKARAKAQQLLDDVRAGRINFENAARQNSEDPGSASQGGDLGWSPPDRYDPAFRDALVRLKPGQYSAPVRSSFGWHIIQMINSRTKDATNEAYKEQAQRIIFNQKLTEETQIWMQQERAAAYIKHIN